MQLFINQLVDAIKADYKRWMPPTFMDGTANANRQTMIDEFCARVRVTEGKKYYKVIQGTSVWGFIVKDLIEYKPTGVNLADIEEEAL